MFQVALRRPICDVYPFKRSLYSKIAIFSFQKTHEAYTTWFLTCYTSINNNNDFFCIIHRVHQGSEPIKAIKAAKIRINKLKKWIVSVIFELRKPCLKTCCRVLFPVSKPCPVSCLKSGRKKTLSCFLFIFWGRFSKTCFLSCSCKQDAEARFLAR